jgi:hypothetical protein
MNEAISLYEYRDLLISSRSLFSSQLTFYESLISAYLVKSSFRLTVDNRASARIR